MSERDDKKDSQDNITVLFPKGEHHEDEQSDSSKAEDAEDTAQEESKADVVRLDFGAGEGRSLREVVDEAAQGDVDQTKLEVFRRMIDGGMVMVTLNTQVPTVEVPRKFEGLEELRLNFSHLFHIDDFDYDEEGVRASLSFEGQRHFCDIPWEAVLMLYSHETGDVVVFEPGGLTR